MKRHSGFWLASLMTVVGLGSPVVSAHAYESYIGANGTSTGGGTCGITIESFGTPGESPGFGPGPGGQFHVDVPIPAGSTPANTAARIRQDLDIVLPPDYEVTIPAGRPDLVKIFRAVGTFTTEIVEDVPGQTIQQVQIYLPGLGPPGWALLSALLLGAGAILVTRRARRSIA